MAIWRIKPDVFMAEVMGFKALGWQIDAGRNVALARAGKLDKMRFAIRSGTGVGKTAWVANMIIWHLCCFPDSKIPCTAPTAPQLKAVLWPEIRKWVQKIGEDWREIFPLEVTTDMVKLEGSENFAVARTARDEAPEAFQGFHAQNIMLIADEASGVPDAIYMAGQGVMSSVGAITILIGNPTRATGYFFDAFHSDSHLYWTKRVGCDESEMVNPEYITIMRDKHGEQSYEYQVRVMGEFHLEAGGIIIPRPWIDAAVVRNVECDSDWTVWGVDVSDGKDKTAIAKRKGNWLLEPTKAWGGKTALQSVAMVAEEYFSTPTVQRPQEICVDAVGMGTIFARRLAEVLEGEPVRIKRVNVAETGANIGERYVSRRVELWATGREWFESMLVKMPKDDALMAQLSSVEWEIKDSNGKWCIPDKSVGGKSPDNADAFLVTFAGSKGKHRSTLTNGRSYRKMGQGEYAESSASYLQRS